MRKSAIVIVMIAAVTVFAQETYFPKGALSNNDRSDAFKATWYTSQLKALNEPSLSERARDSTLQTYRFTWLRSFHHPVAIRVEIRDDGTALIFAKVASGAGGYKPGSLTQNTSSPLTSEQVAGLVESIHKLGFWDIPSVEEGVNGCDGAQWIIEGIKEGKYHLVDRWSPSKGPVHDLGFMFLRLARMNIAKNEIY